MSDRSQERRFVAVHRSLVVAAVVATLATWAGGPVPAHAAAGLTGCTGMPDGTACDDGNPCTTGDACRGGNCVSPATFISAVGSPVTVGTSPRSIGAGDWNNDGKIDLTVPNNTSNDVTILVGNGAGSFSVAGSVSVGTNPRFAGVADLNGDHKLDLAVANRGSANVTILMGNGSGGFAPAAGSPIGVGTNPQSLVVADLNEDGKPDLAVANQGSANVTVLLGDGSGGFTAAAGSPVTVGGQPTALTAADLNGDGHADLAVTSVLLSNLTILAGNGSGDFTAATPAAVGASPQAVVAGDWDGDGQLDLAAANSNPNNVSILMGNGALAFTAAAGSPVSAGTGVRSLATGDVNGDGRHDLIVGNNISNNVTILLSAGGGAFSQAAGSPLAAGTDPQGVAVGDWNGDGKVDVASANAGTNNLTVVLNSTAFAADGTACSDGNPCTLGDACQTRECLAPVSFQGAVPYGATDPASLTSGDWNGDGTIDLAVAGGCRVTAFLGTGGGAFTEGATLPGCGSGSLSSGDWNSDGTLDLIEIAGNDNVSIQLGNGAGGFTASGNISVGNPVVMITGDWNGDGRPDLAVGRNVEGLVTIFLGDGLGHFTFATNWGICTGSMVAGDWNQDGKLDLAVTCSNGTSIVQILMGNGAGGFSDAPGSPVPLPAGSGPSGITTGDWNRDGKADLATANDTAGTVSILFGEGGYRFHPADGPPIAVAPFPSGVSAGDFNGDGLVDLAVARRDTTGVALLLGNGHGRFTHAGSVGSGTATVIVRDLSADGKLDLVIPRFGFIDVILDNRITAPDGTSCDDADICTSSDACQAGRCTGPPVPGPDEVGNNVLVTSNGTTVTIGWSLPNGATSSAVLRGVVSGLPVGPGNGNGDETCLATVIPAATLTLDDVSLPGTGSGYWYLVRADNACGKGPYGFQAYGGVPTLPRVTTTCP